MEINNANRRRSGGSSLIELNASLIMAFGAAFGMDFMGDAAEKARFNKQSRSQAIAIAEGQTDVMMAVPFRELSQSADYLPAGWVHQPGYANGQVPIEVSVDGEFEGNGPTVYQVDYRSISTANSGHLLRLEVRVSYRNADGLIDHVKLRSVRAG